MAIPLNSKGLPPQTQRKLETMAKEKLSFSFDTGTKAPQPKSKVADVPELKDALAKLPRGASFLVKEDQCAARIVRVHVARAAKAAEDNKSDGRKFVTRTDKEANGIRIWAV